MPPYLQLVDQVRHAVDTGVLKPGDQLPSVRTLAEQLVMNANTVLKALRELEYAEVVEIRPGAGAFISNRAVGADRIRKLKSAQNTLGDAIRKAAAAGLSPSEIRRLIDAELRSIDARQDEAAERS